MSGRKNIYELISDNFDLNRELKNIMDLWDKKHIIEYHARYEHIYASECSVESFVDTYYFSGWKARGFCISCADMRARISLLVESVSLEDKIISYLEYYTNILQLFISRAKPSDKYTCDCNISKDLYILYQNIDLLIEKMAHHVIYDENLDFYYIVPKSAEAIAAAEISSDKTGLAILKYHHALLKGQLEEKRQILEAIATENEQLLKKPPQECKTLCDKTRGLINTMNIRHNNTKESEVFAKLSPKEQENWYDEIYQMLLLCVLENDNIARMKKVKQVFQNMKEE